MRALLMLGVRVPSSPSMTSRSLFALPRRAARTPTLPSEEWGFSDMKTRTQNSLRRLNTRNYRLTLF